MARRYRREPMKVSVVVYDNASGDIQSEHKINLSNLTDARWLQRLIKRACGTNLAVEISCAPEKPPRRRLPQAA